MSKQEMGNPDSSNTRKDISYSAVKNDKFKDKFQLEELDKVPTIGVRHGQCAWLCIMIFIAYGVRVILSVAIVAMTDPAASINPDIPTFPNWTQQGAILSAFFWGYIWPQIFAGYAANRFGAKWFLVTTMGIQSILGISTPLIAGYFGEWGLISIRASQGFCQGFFVPTVTHVMSQWIPQEERSRLSSVMFGSVPSGTIVALLVTGIIAAGPYGWPMVFYLYGSLGLLWCLLFSFFGYNSPAVHPSISTAEKYYIENSLGHTDEKPSHKVPWKAIFTSKPVWALLAAQCSFVFGFWILLTQIPTYMNRVMHFNIKDNSMLSSLPYVVQLVLALGLGVISDFIINKKMLGQTASRKLFTVIGALVPAVALILLAYTKSNEPSKAVVLLMIAVGSSAAGNLGWGLNCMDLTSNHSGTLMGLCNAAANVFSIGAPLMAQILVKNQNDPEQWKIIFFVAAGFCVVTTIIYVIFASSERQPWNEDESKQEDKEKQ